MVAAGHHTQGHRVSVIQRVGDNTVTQSDDDVAHRAYYGDLHNISSHDEPTSVTTTYKETKDADYFTTKSESDDNGYQQSKG